MFLCACKSSFLTSDSINRMTKHGKLRLESRHDGKTWVNSISLKVYEGKFYSQDIWRSEYSERDMLDQIKHHVSFHMECLVFSLNLLRS